jgi:hypothetical protein
MPCASADDRQSEPQGQVLGGVDQGVPAVQRSLCESWWRRRRRVLATAVAGAVAAGAAGRGGGPGSGGLRVATQILAGDNVMLDKYLDGSATVPEHLTDLLATLADRARSPEKGERPLRSGRWSWTGYSPEAGTCPPPERIGHRRTKRLTSTGRSLAG